ncbi:hypothetical protein PQR02_13635 [Paraburkholderia sediminicola]|uniref:Uncharacterized protein n=1 Tax=Paraburkholderia rhynchosiae TaxID=487049 RepID=A0ACC7NKG2_9BURK
MQSFTSRFQSASRARLLTAIENGLTALSEQLCVSALLPKGRDNVKYLAAHAAVSIGSNGLIGKFNAAHYRKPTS